jgi:hypothetical protein
MGELVVRTGSGQTNMHTNHKHHQKPEKNRLEAMSSAEATGSNGSNGNANGSIMIGTTRVKQGLAQMLKGGVIVRCSKASDPIHHAHDLCGRSY